MYSKVTWICIYIVYMYIYIYIFLIQMRMGSGGHMKSQLQNLRRPCTLFAGSAEIASPPCLMLPGRTALGSPCRPPVSPCGDPSWRAVRTAWLTPAPRNPPGSSKPPWVCTGQNWEFKPHVTAHRSISVRLIGFWKKTGSYLTVLVVVLPECLRKARNSDFCVECFN